MSFIYGLFKMEIYCEETNFLRHATKLLIRSAHFKDNFSKHSNMQTNIGVYNGTLTRISNMRTA